MYTLWQAVDRLACRLFGHDEVRGALGGRWCGRCGIQLAERRSGGRRRHDDAIRLGNYLRLKEPWRDEEC